MLSPSEPSIVTRASGPCWSRSNDEYLRFSKLLMHHARARGPCHGEASSPMTNRAVRQLLAVNVIVFHQLFAERFLRPQILRQLGVERRVVIQVVNLRPRANELCRVAMAVQAPLH